VCGQARDRSIDSYNGSRNRQAVKSANLERRGAQIVILNVVISVVTSEVFTDRRTGTLGRLNMPLNDPLPWAPTAVAIAVRPFHGFGISTSLA
jgi:hypothetical protein